MASRDIRTFFGQGGGDDEKKESERAKKQIEKRKADQKSYDKAKRRRLIQESWLEEFTWAVLVLMLELFIPLVLFFILIGIRSKQPSKLKIASTYSAQPLPSAGVISVMQHFCPSGRTDENGFEVFDNSRVKPFLQKLNNIVEENNIFNPQFTPNELDEIPEIYKKIVEDPIAIHDSLKNMKDKKIFQLVKNVTEVENFLCNNLTFNCLTIKNIFNLPINLLKVYQSIFGMHDEKMQNEDSDIQRCTEETNDVHDIRTSHRCNHTHQKRSTDSKEFLPLDKTEITNYIIEMLWKKKINPVMVAQTLKMILLKPKVMKFIVCSLGGTFSQDKQHSDEYAIGRKLFCSLSDTQLELLQSVLSLNIDDKDIVKFLGFGEVNIRLAQKRIYKLISDIHKFSVFEKTLSELSVLASALPQDECLPDMNFTTTPSPENTTEPERVDDFQTDQKQEDKKPGYGLLRIWMAMEETICGTNKSKNSQLKKKDLHKLSLDDLGMSTSQKEDVGILVYNLYSNPKILYAPNNTDADKIIKKANVTFELLNSVNMYAEKILNVTEDIRNYLMMKKTEHDLIVLRQIQHNLKQFPFFLKLTSDPFLNDFLNNTAQAYNSTLFLKQLESIENAACAVFQMNKNGSMPNHMIYKIRQNATFTAETNLVRRRYWSPGPRSYHYSYYKFGFVWIQDILERAMISVYAGQDVIDPGLYIHQFPYPCYLFDNFLFMIEHVMPLCLTVSWVYSVAMLVQNIVYEKEQRLKEVMKMMGLTNAVHWLAWFITSFLQMSVTMVILTVLLKFGKVLTYSNAYLIFLTLEVFAIATITFSFLISVLYSKAKIAAASAGIIYFLTYVPYMYVAVREEAAHDHILSWLKFLTSLLSTSAFGLGAKYFAYYEIVGVGVQWSNLAISPVEDDKFNLMSVLIMMLVDTLIYAILVWYIENVHPGAYGLPKPWYFPFTRSYWAGHKIKARKSFTLRLMELIGIGGSFYPTSIMEEDQACAVESNKEKLSAGSNYIFPHSDPTMFETEPALLSRGVCIEKLTKYYKSTNKLAVNKLSLNLYESQITSFLGHNGAGKTTTMSILTGLFPPSSGYAVIYGHDIRSEMDNIRKSLGMCPQHNVLFNELTVEEHLWFYSRLKGTPAKDIQCDMDQFIRDTGLPQKKKCKIDCLSGGMKRKLSVAIAFVGGSRTIILDEPTAGIDPYSRRAIWDLILKYKKGRTILLSTHHMDEADMLSDRIAIISNGQIKCCGSSLFLKNNLGDGYHLHLVKKSSSLNADDNLSDNETEDANTTFAQHDGVVNDSFVTDCCEAKIMKFIKMYIPSAYLMSETKHELHYILPLSELKKGNYIKFFKELEINLDCLHISSYGIKNATLEEVFLRVTQSSLSNNSFSSSEMTDNKKDDAHLSSDDYLTDTSSVLNSSNFCGSQNMLELKESVTLSNNKKAATCSNVPNNSAVPLKSNGSASYYQHGKWLYFEQFIAIIVKRYQCTKRNKKGLFSQILLPAFFVVIAMSVALTAPKIEDMPPIILSSSQYYNYTQPSGNVIPYANHYKDLYSGRWSKDGDSKELVKSLHFASGVGATCVLKSPYIHYTNGSTFFNFTNHRNFRLLSAYFDPMCQSVFVPGLPLVNFVPPVPTALPPVTDKSHHINTSAHISQASKPIYYSMCQCTKDKFVCGPVNDYPKKYRVVTGDVLMDVSSQNEHKYYFYTTDMYRLRRYGAFSFGHTKSDVPNNFGRHSPALFRKIAVKDIAKVWYNHKGYHSIPTYINAMNNAILRANIPKHKGHAAGYGEKEKLVLVKEKLKKMIHKRKVAYKDIIENHFITNDLKSVWKGIKIISGYGKVNETDKSPLQNLTTEYANELNLFYNRFDKYDFSTEICELESMFKNSGGLDIVVSEEDVRRKFGRLNSSKAAGPDKISAQVLRSCSSQLANIYSIIFNMCFSSCIIPNLWKQSCIVPIPKKSCISSMNDLRPVALTPIAMKVCEEFFLQHLKPLVNSFLDPLQFAYQPSRGCDDAILFTLEKLYSHLEKSHCITAINHPMPGTNAIISLNQILQGTDVLISIFIIAAMAFVPASFVLFLVYERFTKAKHLQTVSGLNLVVYWVSNYFWDMCNYVVPATCCVLILLIFDIPAYASTKNFPAVVSLFLMYGWSITPVMYPASFVFKEPSTAYIFLILINLFIGITCVITSFMLEPFRQDESLVKLHNILKDIFLVFPNYCLGRGLMDIAFNEYNNFFLFKTGQYEKITSPFAWNLVSRKLVAMAISGIVFFIITLLCEFRFFIKKKEKTMNSLSPVEDEDEDLKNERRRVMRGKTRNDLLVIKEITKVYSTRKLGKNLAVNKLCLGVPEGECFGLLGVNGAGKSTTFRMLTGDTSITAGDAYVNGFSVKNEFEKVQPRIGYCPQFDALYDELTTQEHLKMYAKIRGVPRKEQNMVIKWALEKFDLGQYANKPARTLSGGTKRKLSTAIALIGDPHLLFLDEPTTGMDPYARRFLWDRIISLVKEGRSVILTSHSMEECEALCSRLAIMVNGQFKCLGSIQHLKNRFGEGYCVSMRTKIINDDYDNSDVCRYFRRTFPEAVLKEKHYNLLKYELKSESISLSYVFAKMEEALDELPIEDYSVSQNTLDNVFINFVKKQNDHRFDEMNNLDNECQNSTCGSQEILLEDDNCFRIEQSRVSLFERG
ncbi:ATP-binding cassette sub-family A member 2 [Nymphon striatum]|nr:ATP-binding cassette sub-family A member 2 [Nymphon striatum]